MTERDARETLFALLDYAMLVVLAVVVIGVALVVGSNL